MDAPDFGLFDHTAGVDISRRNLPHWFQPNVTAFLTFRTVDSLPRSVLLLPYIDQAGLYNQIKFSAADIDAQAGTDGKLLRSRVIPGYLCPSDTHANMNGDRALQNYAACVGPFLTGGLTGSTSGCGCSDAGPAFQLPNPS